MTVELFCGDCLEILPTLPDKSVDAIITDLPYGTTACKWDVIIPLEEMWKQVKRLCKGAFVTTASQPFTSVLTVSNLEWFKYEWSWDKVNRNTNYGNIRFMPLRRHENILVFSKNGHTYNPQMGTGKPYKAKRSGAKPAVYQDGGLNPKDGINLGARFPVSVLQIEADNKKEMGQHPTQKPVALYEYLIRTYTNEGDTVLDFCAGSGTTGVAAIRTNRNAILIEKEPQYFEVMQKRIEAAQAQMVMPL